MVGNVWPQAIVQTCIIHLLRNTFRLTSRKYWDEIKRDVKPIYTAVNATAARAAFDELAEKWGQRYRAVDPALGQRLGGVHPVPGLWSLLQNRIGTRNCLACDRGGVNERNSSADLGSCGSSMYLLDVECGCGEMQFVRRVV